MGRSNGWDPQEVVTAQEIQEKISLRYPLNAPSPEGHGATARRHRYVDGRGVVGFINSISQPFCQDCNRARISATGELHTCLFSASGHPSSGGCAEDKLDKHSLAERIGKVWKGRSDRYSEVRTPLAASEPSSRTEMWQIGG